MSHVQTILKTQVDFLLFRGVAPDLAKNAKTYLVYVVLVAWLVGVGRYWDHPNALTWQYFGLGSVAYVFVLSAFLYAIVLPLKPENWTYVSVLVFVGLTSLPGILYAVPVEQFMSLKHAQQANATFLALVAVWRVALYMVFLTRVARLGAFRIIVATLLPLSAIIVALAGLNLEHVVFDIMAGIREESASPNDIAYTVVFTLSLFAYIGFPVTLLLYLFAIFHNRKGNSENAAD